MINNGTEHDYKLTIHASTMLVDGIDAYLKLIKRLYKHKIEAADYCDLMLWTATKEATRLLNWMKQLNTGLVSYNMSRLEELLVKMDKFREVLKKARIKLGLP
jgi:succinylarginine dihydrolase